jgi:hypothetical protein
VALLDARGRVTFEKNYDSGRLEAHGNASNSPAQAIDRATYVALQRLMLEAAVDVKAYLEARPSPADASLDGGVAPP